MRTVIAVTACAIALLGTAACGNETPVVAGSVSPGAATASPAAEVEGDVTAACVTIKDANRAMFDLLGVVLLLDETSTPQEAAEAAAKLKKSFSDNIKALTTAAGQTADSELLAAIDALVKARTAGIAAVDAAGTDGTKVAKAAVSDAAGAGERAVLGICNR
ncbi:hypothetical protein F4553_001483 [Allocatelliglobosispora scoriae]|uniref:Lipoprotein n=1 Tax=Allocatelliglobosispora scoriae TaxID=643052 RepID=A0A841BIL1_9ACTN|nr:hypothetical protein [Allocatelliglobosispora scoriae]MBB5868104.1 hypothetical protein [Allocatelliglobosispora scoriae]